MKGDRGILEIQDRTKKNSINGTRREKQKSSRHRPGTQSYAARFSKFHYLSFRSFAQDHPPPPPGTQIPTLQKKA
jgi:hypothetical protein